MQRACIQTGRQAGISAAAAARAALGALQKQTATCRPLRSAHFDAAAAQDLAAAWVLPSLPNYAAAAGDTVSGP